MMRKLKVNAAIGATSAAMLLVLGVYFAARGETSLAVLMVAIVLGWGAVMALPFAFRNSAVRRHMRNEA